MPRYRAVVAGAVLFVLAAVSTAAAHQGNAHYRSLIGAVTPAVPGVKLQVLNFDDRLALQNTSGKAIVIQGYNGEPYARVLGDGTVQVNQRSPAYFLEQRPQRGHQGARVGGRERRAAVEARRSIGALRVA